MSSGDILELPILPHPAAASGEARPFPTGRSSLIAGGVVAHNEEGRIEAALASLLGQDLPPGVEWSQIWVVASGCTDRTVEVARRIERDDARLRVLVETERHGKARAIASILRHAEGEAVVLLNADAVALPGAVTELLCVARGATAPYAVMGRPTVPAAVEGRCVPSLELMWELHHRFHAHLQQEGGGAHLSDELLLVSLDPAPPIPAGTINDGSYFGVWLAEHNGDRRYAEKARVEITVPRSWRDHLHQRRRILFGNDQIVDLLGRAPSTMAGHAVRHPGLVARLTLRSLRERERGIREFALLALAEGAAQALALWDRSVPRRDHVRWRRLAAPSPPRALPLPTDRTRPDPPPARAADPSGAWLAPRLSTLVEVAAEFGGGVPLPELLALLPSPGPQSVAELEAWIGAHPTVARIENGVAFVPRPLVRGGPDRHARGVAYRDEARRLFAEPLRPFLRWVRCVAVTGSVAYGEPASGDDLDLFVVCRPGTLYLFLACAYLALRFDRRRPRAPEVPVPCFNYVVDERRAHRDFARDRGFLFAREALSAVPVVGEGYYRSLLGDATWMRARIPGLYDLRAHPSAPVPDRPLSRGLRAANAFLYPLLSAYLQLIGLYRNARLSGSEARDRSFRTMTRPSGLAFVSHRFEALRRRYDSVEPPAGGSAEPAAAPRNHPLPR